MTHYGYNSSVYDEAEQLYQLFRQVGMGRICDAAEVNVSPDGRQAVFAGSFTERIDGRAANRICQIDLSSGDIRVLSLGLHTERLPKYSPDGRVIAFLADSHTPGDFQLRLLDIDSGRAHQARVPEGWIEDFQWSPDGTQIVLRVAGYGADLASVQGAVSSKRKGNLLSWIPSVDTGNNSERYRRAWRYNVASDCMRQVTLETSNIWEAVWCGHRRILALVSHRPDEGAWFKPELHLVDLDTGSRRVLHIPRAQLGCLAGSTDGKYAAVVEAICSDRYLVAGDLLLIEIETGAVRRIDTDGVDITYIEALPGGGLLLAGQRGLSSVVGVCDPVAGSFRETWSSWDISSGGLYLSVSRLHDGGDFVMIGEGFARAPEIAVVRAGSYKPLKSFDYEYAERTSVLRSVERVHWQAPDGLDIQGWLLLPPGNGPYPLLLYVHGGPVWLHRPGWLGRRGVHFLMLIRRGYAVFLPNPRGSSGRGQEFVRRVMGDMGGRDSEDLLCGVDALVKRGVADAARLAVAGVSYGGFMASWLITRDHRFRAAVSVCPHTNFLTYQLVSNQADFVPLFLNDTYANLWGKYFTRSPVIYAHQVKTPTLNICGALDRCTPPEEAIQFHNALLEGQVESQLVMYPEEGHGIRNWPAVIDYTARLVSWFDAHVGADKPTGDKG